MGINHGSCSVVKSPQPENIMTTPQSSKPPTRQGVSKFDLQLAGENKRVGNRPTNAFSAGGPTTRLTQEDQDNADKEKERESVHALVQTWMDNLQLISVITTFFVATEASLLGITIPSPTDPGLSSAGQLANTGLMCALIIHAHAAIIAFLAAFFLIRYKLAVAQKEEEEAERELAESPTSIRWSDLENPKGSQTSPYGYDFHGDPVRRGRVRVNSPFIGDQIIWSSDPRLVQVGPFWQGQPPTQLLARCHSLCIFLSVVGFVLALMGALTYAWDQLPLSVSLFTSISTGFCLVAAVMILIIPSTNNSHIYFHHNFR